MFMNPGIFLVKIAFSKYIKIIVKEINIGKIMTKEVNRKGT